MKRYRGIITAIPFVLSIMCFSIKMMTPEYVDAQGILHEQFFLIPLAYLFFFIGVGMLIFNLVSNIRANNAK